MSNAHPKNPEQPSRSRARRHGPAPASGSSPARLRAAAILEVLAGVRRPSEAAQALGTGPSLACKIGARSGPVPAGKKTSPGAPTGDHRDPEVLERPARRRFLAEYKLQILRQADACDASGQLGELLRREGLYSSHLSTWRTQREQGTLDALSPKKRGRKPRDNDPLIEENRRLERVNLRLVERLRQAEVIIDVPKKVAEIRGIPLQSPKFGEPDS